MISFYETIQIRWLLTALGSGAGISAFTDILGNLDGVNAAPLTFHIRREAEVNSLTQRPFNRFKVLNP